MKKYEKGAKSWENVEKVWESMRKHEKVWESMIKYEKVCKSWESIWKYEKVWESMNKYEKVWGCAQFADDSIFKILDPNFVQPSAVKNTDSHWSSLNF